MRNSLIFAKKHRKLIIPLAILFLWKGSNAQRIGNYVSNGSFEDLYDCSSANLLKAKYWMGIDSVCNAGAVLSVCNGSVPTSVGTYQYPHNGKSFLWTIFYFPTNSNSQRKYPKNRLKSKLEAGKTYCVKFYVNITNRSTDGINGFGAYFGDNNIDTINYCNLPLNFIIPQVQNPGSNIIVDTLNWVPITGTFTANGTEKFLLLGNFLANSAVSTQTINPASIYKWTEVTIDDVSCIEVDLPAYAGNDMTIYLGDSAYIGREKDFAIDTGCVWYQLPNTTTALDTVSGLYVKPNAIGTYTYVVRQELACSSMKWDTIVVTVRAFDVGISENYKSWKVDLYPNPASNKLIIQINNTKDELNVCIADMTGRVVLSKEIKIENYASDLDLDLANGAYMVKITNEEGKNFTNKLLIMK